MSDKQKIVILGGGTGAANILTGLRDYNDQVDVKVIVAMVDDGGSTGRLRDEFNLPPGDIRNCMLGIAKNDELTEVLAHRFEKGEGLKGHNVGNLLLVALVEMNGGSIPKALESMHKILRVQGEVIPVTLGNLTLCATYEDGTVVESQTKIDNEKNGKERMRIEDIHLKENTKAYDKAVQALKEADKIIMGPGDLYSSVLSNVIVDGIKEAINSSHAMKIFVANIMTKITQTYEMTTREFAAEVEKYLEENLDYVIVNTGKLPKELVDNYQDWDMVVDDTDGSEHYKVIKDEVWYTGDFKKSEADVIKRSFIRHDPEKLAKIIVEI